MALSGATPNTDKLPELSITTDTGDTLRTTSTGDTITATIPSGAQKIIINCDACADTPVFYTTLATGYQTQVPRAHSDGISITREYFDSDGNRITSGQIGDTITVKISARTRGGTDVAPNIVISDLLPGGIIANPDSGNGDMDFIELREGRVLIYTTLTRAVREFTYTAQLGTVGKFATPPISAQSMYNPQISAIGDDGIFTVSDVTEK